MSSSTSRRITLVLDPWRISSIAGEVVADFQGERNAFRKIEGALRRDSDVDTVQNLTFIIDASCWEHFRSYRNMAGVQVREVTPLGELRRLCGAEPPNWLGNDDIWKWGLLNRRVPTDLNPAAWEAMLAAWLIPGIDDVATIADWLRVMSGATDFPIPFTCDPVTAWIAARFVAVASKQITSREVIDELLSALNAAPSPVSFADVWSERTALLPLLDPNIDNPLRSSLTGISTARQRVLARYLPLLFPLPEGIHKRVSETFCVALRQARVKSPSMFEASVLQLNAVWDGLPDELVAWLDILPHAMTAAAASHLESLPGFERSPVVHRLTSELSPPLPVPAWDGIGPGFEQWTSAYAAWLRRMFLRRELPPEEADPAAGFARWLKDNISVCFNHPERSYLRVSQMVRESLRNHRNVILVLVDALACQVYADLVHHLTDQLGQPPTTSSFVFGPIPTISEVAKAAVLTGNYPDATPSSLADGLQQAYGFASPEMILASNWNDAERIQVSADTRLIVYRDNRLDDQLSTAATFKALLEDTANIFPRIARLITRWVNDLRVVATTPPVVLITADHGFTYGPPPGHETSHMRRLDGSRRCIPVSSRPDTVELQDPSVTFLDADQLHLKSSYIAARGRRFGQGTITGWRLSHGGLLPEEVLIPTVEWFGKEAPIQWPSVLFTEGVRRERGEWVVSVAIINESVGTVNGGSIHLRIVGHDARVSKDVPRLPQGARVFYELTLPGAEHEGSKEVPIDVLLRQRTAGGEIELDRCYHVPKQRQLIERTSAQDEFENMF